MTSPSDPRDEQPVDDADVPDQVKALLQLAAAVVPVLDDAHNAGKRLDVLRDRQDIAVECVKAVLEELQARADEAAQRDATSGHEPQ
ncbi:hypothetical protein ACIBG8_54445 [Nonomuraea sp. NPDC050556]|uniref:hypothetical protein n=1 Tax=Nonomuraea sp. NPDC050556 TaxID=3364369 RepID=UPI00379BBA79